MDGIDINELEIGNFEDIAIGDLIDGLDENSSKTKNDKTCPECGGTEFMEDSARGMIFCECGQVVGDVVDDSAAKRYDDDVGNARCTGSHSALLPQSTLGTQVYASAKLRRLQIWCSMPYKERSNNDLYKRIKAVCQEHGIVQMVEYDAKNICRKVCTKEHTKGDNVGKPIITRGKNRKGIVAGCLFIACRQNKHTRSAREIADYFGIEESDVNRGVSAIRAILKGDPIIKDVGTSQIVDFVERKCNELRIRNINTKVAVTIARNLQRLGIASNHTTYALAAASILLMADIKDLTHINKKVLSQHFSKLTDVTIGKTYNQIQNKRDILVDNAITSEIIRRVNQKKKQRIISKEIAHKMRQFGVDTTKYIIEGEENKIQIITTQSDNASEDNSTDNKYSDNENEEDVTDQDVLDIIDMIYLDMKNSKITLESEGYEKYLDEIYDSRRMVTEFIVENPHLLELESVNKEFFLQSVCTSDEFKDNYQSPKVIRISKKKTKTQQNAKAKSEKVTPKKPVKKKPKKVPVRRKK